MVDISRLDIYDLLYKQALFLGKEKEFFASFGTREDYVKKYGLQDHPDAAGK